MKIIDLLPPDVVVALDPEAPVRVREAMREENREQNRDRRRNIREQITEYKTVRGCLRCGESDARLLTFHHKDPKRKEFDVADGLRNYMIARVWEEIAKCEVLCVDCHRKEHGNERKDQEVPDTGPEGL